MKLVDANVLIYAVNSADPKHDLTRTWLDVALSGTETVGFSWPVVAAFLRLSTRPGLFPRHLPVDRALDLVRSWLSQPTAVIAEPTARHLEVLAGLLLDVGTGGNLVSDADLAALAIEHAATIVTYDRDFDRFAGVSWETPSG